MDWVDPEIGQKQLHPEYRSRGGEMQSINSFREGQDYQRWRPEIAWVELVWVILGVVGTGPLKIRGWVATCHKYVIGITKQVQKSGWTFQVDFWPGLHTLPQTPDLITANVNALKSPKIQVLFMKLHNLNQHAHCLKFWNPALLPVLSSPSPTQPPHHPTPRCQQQ